MIRKSTTDDKEQIQQLMKICFGDKNNLEPYESLEGRYYLYFKENSLVAMTGLTSNSEYRHLEVDWTCTHPEHRHKGYMQELFTHMLTDVKEPIYCSCWRMPNKDIFLIAREVALTAQDQIANATKICIYGRE